MRNRFGCKSQWMLMLVFVGTGTIFSLTATGQMQEQAIQNTDQNASAHSGPQGGSVDCRHFRASL